MAIFGKIVSGHKQFNVASAISNFKKKFSVKIFSVWKDLLTMTIKSNRTKNTSKILRYLMGLIYYSTTILGNISGKNEVISPYCVLKCHGAQRVKFSRVHMLAIL